MTQPIVPLNSAPQSRSFEKKQNNILLRVRLGKLELSIFESINSGILETIIDKVLRYDHPTQ
ncbi:hypothetical protein ABID29_000642 [Streptococcus rupicaprae]|uniref:Transposase n=1 Tax=Streptococcus rupicaprae TaxID=759619 RepID=A0ABV2FG40_9STRE